MRLEPNPGRGMEFINRVKGGNIPREYIPAIEKGFRASMEKGPYAGYPMMDIKFVLLDGSYHAVDSSEKAFRTCAQLAIKEAIPKAAPHLLEPIMKIEVNTPDEYMGEIIGDINRRRGKIDSMRRFRKGLAENQRHRPADGNVRLCLASCALFPAAAPVTPWNSCNIRPCPRVDRGKTPGRPARKKGREEIAGHMPAVAP